MDSLYDKKTLMHHERHESHEVLVFRISETLCAIGGEFWKRFERLERFERIY